MKKRQIIEKIMVLTLIILALFSLSHLVLTSKVIINIPEQYSYTQAICNETNYCEDYLIECDKNEVKRLTPTGQAIQQEKNWIDPREKTTYFCN